MKAVILAGGRGKRMNEHSLEKPKVLLKIAGKPFLYYPLKILEEIGIKEIAIIVCYKKEKIESFVKKYGFKVKFINQGETLGTGHAVKCAKDFVKDNNFIVWMGDDYYTKEMAESINKEDEYCYVFGYRHEHPERFGVLLGKGGFLERIIEKPKEFIGNLVNIGLYKFTPEIFSALDKINLSERGEYELTDAITILAKKKKVKVINVGGGWYCLNIPEDIERMKKFFKEKKMTAF